MSYSLLIGCKQQNVVQISHGVMDWILIFFPQFSSKYPRFGEEFGHVGESPMTKILSPISLLIPQIWGITPETVTLGPTSQLSQNGGKFKSRMVDEIHRNSPLSWFQSWRLCSQRSFHNAIYIRKWLLDLDYESNRHFVLMTSNVDQSTFWRKKE